MGPLDFLLHLGGFVAPAFALGLLMALAGPRLPGAPRVRYAFWPRAALLAAAGVAALLAGLLVFGRDGKMASYGLLLVAVATGQWLMAGGWRR